MSFQLTIAEGKEAGKEFVFDQTSIVIGRTSDCDVILYDPGVSRKHARIYAEGELYYVEDMGSSNGTKVNGAVIKKHRLADGDAVALGPVVFSFSATIMDEAPAGNGVASQSTRIVAADKVKRQRNKGVAMLPADTADEQVEGLQRASTMTMQAVSRPRVPSKPGNAALKRSSPSNTGPSNTGGKELAPRPSRPAGPAQLSAADRARIRRESKGMQGNLRIFWHEASAGVKRAIYAVATLCVLGLLGGAYYVVLAPDDGPKLDHPEPNVLDRTPITDSFGLGDVNWKRSDMKVFSFQFNAPVRAVVIIHFQSKDVSQGEVVVTVNGADVGVVPPDTINSSEHAHEMIVAPSLLKKGQVNQVIFDNTKNPPGDDSWRIWNLWIETALLPEIPPDQLLAEAKASFQRATKAFDARDIGAGNRYEAWREFRNAWLNLEAHPEPKPELYLLARDKMKEAQRELDNTCSKLLLECQQNISRRDWQAARATLDHISAYFPNTDQACNLRAEQIRYDNNL